jgi:hypothetical protein
LDSDVIARRTSAGFVASLLAIGVVLAGCGTSTSPSNGQRSVADLLWTDRTPYVGDNSRVIALVAQLFPRSDFTYTVSVQTSARPYGVTVTITRSGKPYDLMVFGEQTTLLLGLVGNLDTVTIASASSSHSTTVTAASAGKTLGYDVKELGRDQRTLAAYLDAVQND